MALGNTVVYDIEQFKVYAMSSVDSIGGASPTYAAGITLRGAADLSFTPNVISNDLKGDGGRVISKMGRVDRLMITLTYGALDENVMAVLCGGTVTDSGAGASESLTYALSMPNLLPFFKCTFLCIDTDNGTNSLIGTLYKCMIKSATFTDPKTDAYGQPKLDLEGIPLISTGAIGTVVQYASLQTLP